MGTMTVTDAVNEGEKLVLKGQLMAAQAELDRLMGVVRSSGFPDDKTVALVVEAEGQLLLAKAAYARRCGQSTVDVEG